MKRIRALASAALTMAVLLSLAGPASATTYSVLGCKFNGSDPSIWYFKGGIVTTKYWDATGAGAARWNAVTVPGTFYPTTGGSYQVYVNEMSFVDPTIWAQTQGACSTPGAHPASSWAGNQVTLTWATEGAAGLTTTQLRMVATHELGHGMGLDHISTTSCSGTKSVMVQGTLKWTCTWGTEPWQNDIDNVIYVYN